MYLVISNPGVANPETFCLFGASTTRKNATENTIGCFGSGFKMGLNLCLREGHTPVIYCGNLRLEFFTTEKDIDDNLSVSRFNQVYVKFSGKDETGKTHNYTKELGWVLEYGETDWSDMAMGLREFVANAIDRTEREGKPISEVTVEITDKKPRATNGYTKVYIQYTPSVAKFHKELNKRFLKFAGITAKGVLPKVNRSLDGSQAPMFYKQGVFVRSDTESNLPSLFDYNFGSELTLDESRNATNYDIRSCAAMRLLGAEEYYREEFLRALKARRDCWEVKYLSGYSGEYFLLSLPKEKADKVKADWAASWQRVFGKDAVFTTSGPIMEDLIRKKGFTPVNVKDSPWERIFKALELPGDNNVLSSLELSGNIELEATPTVRSALDKVWALLEKYGKTNGKEKPAAKCFDRMMEAGTQLLGEYKEGVIYVHKDYANAETPALYQIVLEEVAHHVTGAGDMSRDFQEFLIRLLVEIAFPLA